jgi:hypothetical protein
MTESLAVTAAALAWVVLAVWAFSDRGEMSSCRNSHSEQTCYHILYR